MGVHYLDDFEVGQTFQSDTLKVEVEDIKAFARQFDPQPFHLDETSAKGTFFDGLAASGWHTAALTMRGMTEAEARARGHSIRIGTRPMTRVGRAREKGETKGFMKLVVDAKTDLILGAALLGVGGDEAVHGVIEAMAAGVTASAYTRVVAIHPTVAELLPTAFGDLKPHDPLEE
jgi:hypothetical protein